MGVDFQEELSDMLLLKMLEAANRAAADKDKVSVHALARMVYCMKSKCVLEYY